jgi:hypothetical protein
VPPEACPPGSTNLFCLQNLGYQVPPGTNETNGLPTPVFSLTPSATVDEGNNWINMRWGPLSLTNPTATGGAYGSYGGGALLGNFAPTAPALNHVPLLSAGGLLAPSTDFFGNPRKTLATGAVDSGAIEGAGSPITPFSPRRLQPQAQEGRGAETVVGRNN